MLAEVIEAIRASWVPSNTASGSSPRSQFRSIVRLFCESPQSTHQQLVGVEQGFLLEKEHAGCLGRDALEFDHVARTQLSDGRKVGRNHAGNHRITPGRLLFDEYDHRLATGRNLDR